jgi:uncharacterized glyoxalase superfamily protein PhnB
MASSDLPAVASAYSLQRSSFLLAFNRDFMSAQPTFSFQATELAVSLTVKDLPKSLAWYRDVIGFAVTKTHEREGKLIAVSLKAGEVRILLSQDDGGKGLDRSKGAGFSLQLTTEQNVDEIAERVRAQTGALDTEPTVTP